MIYTEKIQKAIKFSIKTHEVYQKQKRKGKDIPYITHPLTVGLILAKEGASEDVIAAGILHDTIEDSIPKKKVTKEMLSERFGKHVADLVSDISEQSKDIPWKKRKEDAIVHVKRYSHDTLLVKSADIISNITELISDYEKEGDSIFTRFKAIKKETIHNYLSLIKAITERWPQNPFAEDLRRIKVAIKKIANKS